MQTHTEQNASAELVKTLSYGNNARDLSHDNHLPSIARYNVVSLNGYMYSSFNRNKVIKREL